MQTTNPIYAYRLTNDTGFAPCIDNNTLTLACCKGGQIRKEKNVQTGLRYHIGKHRKNNPDDEIYLLGVYKNRLLYYAEVTDVLEMTDYYSKKQKAAFGRRLDHIFDTENGTLKRNRFMPDIHPESKTDLQWRRDINGVYVIVSNRFTYFGTKAPEIPPHVLEFLPKGVGNKKITGPSDGFDAVSHYINAVVSFDGVIGNPHNPLEISESGGCGKKLGKCGIKDKC
jgi:hypothetical protein